MPQAEAAPDGEPVQLGALRFEFAGKPVDFTPVFPSAPSRNTVSTNAGDHELYVSGFGINRAFQEALRLWRKNKYQRLHELTIAVAEASPGRLVEIARDAPEEAEAKGLREELGCSACFARAGLVGKDKRVGSAFVDIIDQEWRPLHEKNVGMLYVVGPRGEGAKGHGPTIAGKENFLEAVECLGENAVRAVCEYNRLAQLAPERSLPRLEVVQWCLVSGGVYKHWDSSKLDVAAATVRGLLRGAEGLPEDGPDAPPTFRLTYDEDVFAQAVAEEVRNRAGAMA